MNKAYTIILKCILLFYLFIISLFWRPELRCRLTNCSGCRLQSHHSADALAGNQLLPNASFKHDGKALINLLNGLSSGTVVLVSMTDGDLVDHNACLRSKATKRLPSHGNQAQAIAATLLVIIGMLLSSDGLGSDQTLSRCTIDEGGLQRVCNHKVQACVLAGTEYRKQDVSETNLPADNEAGLLEAGLETHLIGNDVLHVRHAVVAANGVRPLLASHGMVAVRVHHV